jgi:hypothetical protein
VGVVEHVRSAPLVHVVDHGVLVLVVLMQMSEVLVPISLLEPSPCLQTQLRTIGYLLHRACWRLQWQCGSWCAPLAHLPFPLQLLSFLPALMQTPSMKITFQYAIRCG